MPLLPLDPIGRSEGGYDLPFPDFPPDELPPPPPPPPAPVDTGTPGDTSNPVNPGAAQQFVGFDKLSIDEGGLLADANGMHVVQGYLVFQERVPGPPIKTTLGYLLGDKQWAGPLRVTYAGEDISPVPLTDANTPGYHFHDGRVSTGTSDPIQGEDTYTPGTGKVYSRTPNLFVRVPDYFAVETAPEKVVGIYNTRLVHTYDSSGAPVSYGYSTNPADVAVSKIRDYWEGRIADPAAALAATQASVIWPAYVAFNNYCAGTLSWNDGTQTRSVYRFECHTAFTGKLSLRQALDAICATACARWQEDKGKITFRLPTDQTISHTFRWHNHVEGSIRRSFKNIATAPRHLHIKFRDIFHPLLEVATEKQIKRQPLIDKFGEDVTEIVLPNMSYSQAQRVGQYRLRMETDNLNLVQIAAPADSLHLLKGDYCRIDLQEERLDGQYLVLKTNLKSAERTPDESVFLLQRIEGALYSDADHLPILVES